MRRAQRRRDATARNAAAGPLLDPRSRAWALLAAGACLLPLLLQLPASLGIAIGAAAVLVGGVAWRRVLPAWARLLPALLLVGLVLSQSRGFGRDTACALLAAMLAIKPAETARLRDGRSLLGFALFAPFATFLLDQGPVPLALALLGATLALAALLRLAELESGDDLHAPSPLRRFARVWRLVGIGLPLALAAFWLFPRLASPLWGVPERAMARPGLSDSMSPGDWLDVLNDDTTALRVQFHGDAPPREAMYWRGPVLWRYDGRTWTRPEWLQGLPPARVEPGASRWRYQLEVEPTDRRQLVALDLPRAAPDGTALSVDYGLLARRPLGALTRWEMASSPPRVFAPELRPTLRRMALQLPAGYNPRTIALARQWRSEAGDGPAADAAIANRAMAMINAGFGYTLAVPLAGRDAVDEFLFATRAGYCEHFSSAFVVLMRAAGIPARVVTGYVGGYRNPIGDYWLVRNSDAHAWAEVWLDGRGWVRMDPTAAVAPERIYDTLADRAPGAGGVLGGIGAPVMDVSDWMRRGWNDFVLGFDATRQRRLLQPLGIGELSPGRLAALFVGAALLAMLWMGWLVARASREQDPLLRAWRRLERRYARIGMARHPHEPASRWAERVAASRPGDADALARLTSRFNNARYARGQAGTASLRALARDLRRHRPQTANP
jgi:transglutaminase-like putative cysteine protease